MCCFDLGDCLCGMCCAVCCVSAADDASRSRQRDRRYQEPRVVYVTPVVVHQAPVHGQKPLPKRR